MRSIGLTKNRIKLLYFYEAILLVLASCILGIFIGIVIGYTMAI
jgi:ABC-type antimicrobial peptide transport system permease subunit